MPAVTNQVTPSCAAKPNSPEIPKRILTPLKPEVFSKYLSNYPDRIFVANLIHNITHGADIGYTGPKHSRSVPNSLSARIHECALTEAIKKEVALSHSIGPFSAPPLSDFIVNSLAVRPKPNGSVRVIMDLSRPTGASVNDFIDKEAFSVSSSTLDNAIKKIAKVGKGCYLAKLDIKHAYRLVPVRPADWPLLGFQVADKYYFDIVLPFGCRSSAYLFCMVSDAIHWIVADQYGKDALDHYVDDYLLFEQTKALCRKLMRCFCRVNSDLGVPVADEKTEGPAQILKYLGILIDTVAQTLSLPEGKLNEILEKLREISGRDSCSQTELQSLIGSLVFAAKCVPAGRLFTRRMIALLSGLEKEAPVVLNADFSLDVDWWLEFLPKWNGTAPFLSVDWLGPSVTHLFTDASATVGFGGYLNGRWFCDRWPEFITPTALPINLMEFIPIYIACVLWESDFAGKKIEFHCDNLGVAQAWRSYGSSNRAILSVMRRIVGIAARSNFAINIRHVPGSKNEIADALSRLQISRFRKLCPNAAIEPTPVPSFLHTVLRESLSLLNS